MNAKSRRMIPVLGISYCILHNLYCLRARLIDFGNLATPFIGTALSFA